VQRVLGEGTRKRVYLAHDTVLDRDVALALIKTEGLDSRGLERVQIEVQAMARLGDHPHVVTVYDIGEDNGQPYIVSQYMAGGDVEQLMNSAPQRRLSLPDALRIAEQVCRALAHAHAHGIIHRDLKPSNIWLTDDGTAKLGDFGLAASRGQARLTQEGMVVGTITYMPPEQALGHQADARSDLYGLGALLYEMVTGRPPFEGDTVVAVISQHVNTPPLAPSWQDPTVPALLDTLIMDLLAKAPEDRPQSATVVLERLQRISAAPVPATSSGQQAAGAEQRAAPESPFRYPESAIPTPQTGRLVWGRLAGRETELATVTRAVDTVLGGAGALLLVAGDAGIGKTRLAEEAAVYARLHGVQVLWGRCYEAEATLPYIPFVEAIRQYVQTRPSEALRQELGYGAADVARLVSAVRQRLPDLPAAMEAGGQLSGGDPAQDRYRLFESVTAFLLNAAAVAPIMLVLDDLHWADKPSLLLLQHVARRLAGSRLLILGTYRDVEVDRQHPLSEALMRLRRERSFERIALRGLTLEEMTALLASAAQQDLNNDADMPVVRALHRQSEGNPFFVEEIVRHLVETGRIFYRDGRWTSNATTIADLEIPDGVREVIGRRLSRLSADCNRALVAAAVLGREFDFAVLGDVTAMEAEALLDVIEEALAAHIIVEVRGRATATYAFSHALMRQTLYDELSVPRRQRMHLRAAQTLAAAHAAHLEPHLGELAYHFFQAGPNGDMAQAVAYARRAAERALTLLAYEEAAGHYDIALQALDYQEAGEDTAQRSSTERQRCELLLALGEAQVRAGETRAANRSLLRAAGIARGLGAAEGPAAMAELLARAALAYHGTGLQAGEVDRELVGLLDETLAALDPADSSLRARVLARLAQELYYSDSAERSRSLSREAVAMAERLGDPVVLATALRTRHTALRGPGSVHERLAVSTEILRLAESSGEPELVLRSRLRRLVDLLEQGDIEGADADIAVYAAEAESLRQPYYCWHTTILRAMRAAFDGRYAEAAALSDQARTLGRPGQTDLADAYHSVQLMAISFERGALAELVPPFTTLVKRYRAMPAWRSALALILAETGDIAAARCEFELLAAHDFTDLPADGNWLLSVAFLAQTCVILDDARRAALLYDLLLPCAHRNVVIARAIACYGSVSRLLGLLAMTMRRWQEAIRHFEQALAKNTAMGARPYVARTCHDYAGMLLIRGLPSDRPRAQALLDQALSIAEELGMRVVVERSLALRVQMQGIPATALTSSIDVVASAAQWQRPNLSSHAAPDGAVTIMFTDIEESSVLTEQLGDRRWLEVLRAHNAVVREHVAAHGGYEVKNQGDGFMVAFSSARQALHCAIGIQRALTPRAPLPMLGEGVPKLTTVDSGSPLPALGEGSGVRALQVRIGLHTGEAIREADDFFGRNVIVASRIAARARGGEIMVSALLKELTESAGEFAFDAGEDVELKGLTGTQRVYTVRWRERTFAGGLAGRAWPRDR
jgi:class 3 adenylate cyclase